MTLGTILLIILILILIGTVPAFPHSRGWGYGPSGVVGVVLIVVLILCSWDGSNARAFCVGKRGRWCSRPAGIGRDGLWQIGRG